MRNGGLVLLSTLGVLSCSGKHLRVGNDGASGGQGGLGGERLASAGQAGAAAGAAGSITPSGVAGTTGAAGQTGGAGGALGAGLTVTPTAATFAGTLVEATSAPQTFTVRNGGGAPLSTSSTLAALGGTNAADFLITANGCAATLSAGASCDIAVAFAPKTRSGARAANLAVGDPSGAPVQIALTGTALPSLGLLAGSIGGPGNRDGTGTGARFSGVGGVAYDGAGNLYVTDGNSVRKIVAATGVVTTLVHDDADLYSTDLVAYDGAGSLYVVAGNPDPGFTLVRITIATGAVSVFGSTDAGAGSGTTPAINFFQPTGIACDAAGNVYVADGTSIQKIAFAAGVVTTFAGPAAGFSQLYGMTTDGAGNFYLVDDTTVRKLDPTTMAVTTLAGAAGLTGTADGTGAAARFSTPVGLTTDGAGNLYLIETTNFTIRKIVIATGEVTTLPGAPGQFGATWATGSRGSHGFQLGSDGAGNLFVPDGSQSVVRKVVIATGAFTTLAGAVAQAGTADGTGSAARFIGAGSVTRDAAGNLYVVDSYAVRKIAVATRTVTTLAGSALIPGSADGTGAGAAFDMPAGITSDGAGNLFVADYNNQTIRKIVSATGAVTTLAGKAGQVDLVDGIGAAARFYTPYGIASDGAGDLFVTEPGVQVVRKVVVGTRAVTTFAGGNIGSADGKGTAAGFDGIAHIASDGAGNLFVADSNNCTIRKIVIATGAVTTFAGAARQSGTADGTGSAARFGYPTVVTSDGVNNLYVIDGSTVRLVALATGAVSTIVGIPAQPGVSLGALPASVNNPRGLVVLPTGELAITDAAENAVLIAHL